VVPCCMGTKGGSPVCSCMELMRHWFMHAAYTEICVLCRVAF
jgi:hypothetical protein